MEAQDACHEHCIAFAAHATPELAPHLEEREASVLGALVAENESLVSFQGLRRRLGLHQQVLARTLRRLERAGLVAREDAGYRPTDAGFAATPGGALRPAPRASLPVVQALLPPGVAIDEVAQLLARRWFAGLRWYGRADAPGESTLSWLTEAGRAVRVRIHGGALSVEVELDEGDAEGFPAIRPLLAALADIYGGASGPAA